jgi:hypothetical protein
VYWHENSPMRTWFELGTASYASGVQPAGSIFSRQKTLEMKRRLERVAIASVAQSVPDDPGAENELLERIFAGSAHGGAKGRNIFDTATGTNPTGPGVIFLCRDPALDWVVSSRLFGDIPLIPVQTVDPQSGRPLFFYRCRAG